MVKTLLNQHLLLTLPNTNRKNLTLFVFIYKCKSVRKLYKWRQNKHCKTKIKVLKVLGRYILCFGVRNEVIIWTLKFLPKFGTARNMKK